MSALGPVIFDLDDTLMPEEHAIRAAFAAACKFAFPASRSKRYGLNEAARARARGVAPLAARRILPPNRI